MQNINNVETNVSESPVVVETTQQSPKGWDVVETSVEDQTNVSESPVVVETTGDEGQTVGRIIDYREQAKMEEERAIIQENVERLLADTKTKKRGKKSDDQTIIVHESDSHVQEKKRTRKSKVEAKVVEPVSDVQPTVEPVTVEVTTVEPVTVEQPAEGDPRLFVKTHVANVAFTNKRPGVIACIVEALSDERQPMTKKQLMSLLIERFPDRVPEQMKNTLMMQVPSGLKIEKRIVVATTVDKQSGERAYYIDKRATYLLQSEYDARKNAQK